MYPKEIVYNKIDIGNLFLDIAEQKMDFSEKAIEVNAGILLGHWTASSASTKIIKKELFEKYKYVGSKANDLTAIYPIMAEAKKIIYMPELYMYYRQVPNSLSRRNSEEEYNSVIDTIVETMKRMESISNSKDKIEILFFNNCLSYFLYVLCQIKDSDVKLSTMKYFIKQIKKYKEKIFKEMKESQIFSVFLKHNRINEATYDLLDEENLIDFLIKSKLDLLVVNNEIYEKQNYDLNKLVTTLAEEKQQLISDIEMLRNELEDIKQSTSWKITKPIRKLKFVVNNIRRKH